jgi:hypothetical protein
MKKIIKIIIASVFLVLLTILISFKISGFVTGEVTSDYPHSWTKAICNETQCQDYQIFCNGNELINKTALIGAVISLPKDWKDPRNETIIDRICNF